MTQTSCDITSPAFWLTLVQLVSIAWHVVAALRANGQVQPPTGPAPSA